MSKRKRYKNHILQSSRRNLSEDFKAEVERKMLEYESSYHRELERWYGYDFWDGYDDDDDLYFENGIWKSSRRREASVNKYSKHYPTHKGNPNKGVKGSKKRVTKRFTETMDPNDKDLEEMYYDDSIERKIYYYEDVNRVKYREFSTLSQFDLFITREQINISDEDIYDLVYLEEVHCCINPIDYSKDGSKNMLVFSSYGDLRWTVSDLSLGTRLADEYCLDEEYEEV